MKGLGAFQMSQMKHRDARVFALCQHLHAAIDLWEQIASAPLEKQDLPVKALNDQVVRPPPTAPPAEKLTYSIKDAAAAVGVGKSTLYKALSDGTLSALRLGNRTLIPAQALRDWVNSWEKR